MSRRWRGCLGKIGVDSWRWAVAGLVLWGVFPVSALAAPVQGPVDPQGAEVQWRWIGVLLDDEELCEPVGGLPLHWTVQPLFSAPAVSRFPLLAKFCVYEYHGSGPVPLNDRIFIDHLDGAATAKGPAIPAAPPPIPPPPRILASVAPDLAAVTPAGTLEDALWPRLAEIFDEEAGQTSLPPAMAGPRVRLTLVDTSPTLTGLGLESSVHGRTLRLMARRLLCSAGPCVAEVRTRLALAFEGVDPLSRSASVRNPQNGGFVGLVSELAVAVVEEIDDWRATAAVDDRLILNLSVAWDPLYGGGDAGQAPAAMAPQVQAVYRALESAACDDQVLVVAAAGNRTDRHSGNLLHQPLLPAAWRERDAACPGGNPGPPLTAAVGAVDRLRQPLTNAIDGGMPEIVAYGDHGVIADPTAPRGHTAVLTGSSVSALIVSATAAAIAAYRPDLDPQGIVAEVYGGGDILPFAADFCPQAFGGSCPLIRAVSFCEGVHAACQPATMFCPLVMLACRPRFQQVPTFPSQGLPSMAWQIDTSPFATVSPTCPSCGAGDFHALGGVAPNRPCPDRQLHGLGRRPYTHPQPQSAMCPTCTYFSQLGNPNGGGSLYVEIDTGRHSGPIQLLRAPTLSLACGPGPPKIYHLVGGNVPSTLYNGDQFLVLGLPSGCASGTLSFVFKELGKPAASISQPVLVAIRN